MGPNNRLGVEIKFIQIDMRERQIQPAQAGENFNGHPKRDVQVIGEARTLLVKQILLSGVFSLLCQPGYGQAEGQPSSKIRPMA